MKTVRSWLTEAKKQIDALDAEIIAVHFFAPKHADRSWLVMHDDLEISQAGQKLADEALKKRSAGEPLAYVLKTKEFYGRDFMVRPGVLIPRPETETLIDLVKELKLPKRARLMDMGTGSGCIAITLALEFPQAYVMGVDVSARALDTAELNDFRHEGRVEFVQSNLFHDLNLSDGYPSYDECASADDYFDYYDVSMDEQRFDVVVANLPYVNRDWRWLDLKQLSYEPKQALFARALNGLSIYKRFFSECRNNVVAHYVVVEADPCQHEELIAMAAKNHFRHLKTQGFGVVFENEWYDRMIASRVAESCL